MDSRAESNENAGQVLKKNLKIESWVDNKCCSAIISFRPWILLVAIEVLFFRGLFLRISWNTYNCAISNSTVQYFRLMLSQRITEAPLKFQLFSWETRNIFQTESAKINMRLLAYFFPLIYISPSTSDHLLTCFSSFHFFFLFPGTCTHQFEYTYVLLFIAPDTSFIC